MQAQPIPAPRPAPSIFDMSLRRVLLAQYGVDAKPSPEIDRLLAGWPRTEPAGT